jgi:hypothetical protein
LDYCLLYTSKATFSSSSTLPTNYWRSRPRNPYPKKYSDWAAPQVSFSCKDNSIQEKININDPETAKSGVQSFFATDKDDKGSPKCNYLRGANQKNYSDKPAVAKGLHSELTQIRGEIQQKKAVLPGLSSHAGVQM